VLSKNKFNSLRSNASPTPAMVLSAISVAVIALFHASVVLAADKAPLETPAVVVVGTTPLPSVGLAKAQIPSPVQTATARDIEKSGALDLSDFLNRSLGSVHVNEMQGNPFQSDVNYRGFTASPLLGTPQGLSIYMDGVRLNQPFGDVVSWDLIPRAAIASLSLMPGSNPVFGLNTLGGALSIQTKDGRKNPGTAVELSAGSYGRRALSVEHGGSNSKGLDWFVTANAHDEDGWRDASPSRLGQLFGKVGWQNEKTDLKLTYAYADTKLTGNGVQEFRLLNQNYNSVYTLPDITENKSHFLNLAGTHNVSDTLLLSGNLYYRKIKTATLNGDINEGSLDQAVYLTSAAQRATLAGAGYSGYPTTAETAANTPFPSWRCIEQVVTNNEPGEKCNGLLNRTWTDQRNAGVSGQFTLLGDLAGNHNQFTAGAAYDESRIDFRQTSQLGYLTPDRGVTGLNAFADGVTGGNVDGEPYDNRVDLSGRIRTWSLYATDTVSFHDTVHLTLSGRYNRINVKNEDHINPGGGVDSLDGDHKFSRFNPAIGLSFTPAATFRAYVGYNEGSRAPTPIELGCANPDNPCRLPNSMAGDPPLNQVVTKTIEAGLSGRISQHFNWNAGVFRANNYEDILFVAAPNATQSGYFKNFGETRRQGFELGLSGDIDKLTLGANYTYLDATYQSEETLAGAANSSNDAGTSGLPEVGNIQVTKGNRIPLIPRQMLKLSADYQFSSAFSVNASVVAVSSSYARGNENNAHQAVGLHYLGSGESAGYAIFNLGAQYRVDPKLKLFGQINNLFDRQYNTAAMLGATGFTANGSFTARAFPAISGSYPLVNSTFFAPGSPRSFMVGVRYAFD
jgi:outer membrane receptor protein involved in Fe transport